MHRTRSCLISTTIITIILLIYLFHGSFHIVNVLSSQYHKAVDVTNATYSYLRNPSRKNAVSIHNRTKCRPLPKSVINGIKTFVFFIGTARSGHSIVVTMLDSHPHIVISDELNVFRVLRDHRNVDKSFLFNQIWRRSYRRANNYLHVTEKGYSLAFDGLYQGSYQSYINVIGDKHGGLTVQAFLANPKLFESRLKQLQTLTANLTIKVFHVIRNPYDNIATMAMYKNFGKRGTEVAKAKNSNSTLNVGHKVMDYMIDTYFKLHKGSEVMRKQFKLDVMDIHNRQLITNPRVIVSTMCNFLQVFCSSDYLDTISRKIFGSESKTRYKVKWTNDQILKVKQNIWTFGNLREYLNFDY